MVKKFSLFSSSPRMNFVSFLSLFFFFLFFFYALPLKDTDQRDWSILVFITNSSFTFHSALIACRIMQVIQISLSRISPTFEGVMWPIQRHFTKTWESERLRTFQKHFIWKSDFQAIVTHIFLNQKTAKILAKK